MLLEKWLFGLFMFFVFCCITFATRSAYQRQNCRDKFVSKNDGVLACDVQQQAIVTETGVICRCAGR